MTDDLREAEAYQASKDKLQTELELLQRQMQNSVPFYSTRYKVIAFIRRSSALLKYFLSRVNTKCPNVIGSQ